MREFAVAARSLVTRYARLNLFADIFPKAGACLLSFFFFFFFHMSIHEPYMPLLWVVENDVFLREDTE